MQHKETKIQTITSMTTAIANPAAGDYLFVDLDDTLLLTGINKYADTPQFTESSLSTELDRLRERGIKVIGLTARKHEHRAATMQQLSTLHYTLDDVIFAPTDKSAKRHPRLQKASALKSYLQQNKLQPKRLFVFDNDLSQLQDIQQSFADSGLQLYLKHYQPRHDQPIAIHQQHQQVFPPRLDGFHKQQALGGGTNSVFSIKHETTGQKFVLKFGAHEDAGKIEMLCNAVYQALGVKVPKMRIYHELPLSLAATINLQSQRGMFQVSELIESHPDQSEKTIRATARQDFIAHVLLGNIDVAKGDNFIVDTNGKAIIIDAGANFMFRAKGETRKEDATLASEIDSLRDKHINTSAHAWFASLTDAEITAQVAALAAKHHTIEQAVWDASNQLGLPENLRNQFLESLSDRLDHLVTRFCRSSQTHAKIDKKGQVDQTAAGILTYAFINNEPHVLLSKRVRHQWWDNLGGKSEAGDQGLADTARREVAEESNYLLNYTSRELEDGPFHDLVTGKCKEQKIYRMYLCSHEKIAANNLNDGEHTEHQWVPLRAVMAAMDADHPVQMEGQATLQVTSGDQTYTLYPPLCQMLRQPEVSGNLTRLLATGKVASTHTLGYADNGVTTTTKMGYRPLMTPARKRQHIATTMIGKSRVLREIKKKSMQPTSAMTGEVPVLSARLTQSELHIKTILGLDYHHDDLAGNVRQFVNRHYARHTCLREDRKKEFLITSAIALIENERRGGEELFYFYHGCNNRIAFAYDIYTALYQALQANEQTAAFRPDSEHFKRFKSMREFVAFYSHRGTKTIDNNDANFNDCALSTNVFLFGNHDVSTSSSIHYLIENDVRREVDLEGLFSSLLQPFHVAPAEIKRLLALFSSYASKRGGSLYQIAMTKEQAQIMAYPAAGMGKMNELEMVRDLPCIVQALQNRDLSDMQTREYITNLQARLLVPPHLPLQVTTMKWSDVTTEQSHQYQQGLQHCVDLIMDLILRHHNPLFNHHGQSGVLKVLPLVLAENQLSTSSKVSGNVLARAIMANDEDTVYRILNNYPEFRWRRLSIPAQYIHNNRIKIRDNRMEPLPMIIHHSKIRLDQAIELYGWESVKKQIECFYHAHFNAFDFGEHIISRLPEKIRLRHVEKYLKVLCRLDQFFGVLAALPMRDRMAFIKMAPARTASGTPLINAQNIKKILKLLAPAEKTEFVLSYKYTINTCGVLIKVLKNLPVADRAEVAVSCGHIDVTTGFVAVMASLLPEDDRLGFVVCYQHLVYNGNTLAHILEILPATEREPFARRHQSVIVTGDDLFEVMQELSPDDASTYAWRHKNKISSVAVLKDIQLLLPESERGKFALAIKSNGLINNNIDFGQMYACLDESQRSAYTTQYINRHQALQDCYFIQDAIRGMPMELRLNFAKTYKHAIDSSMTMAHIISLLNKADRLEFVMSCHDKCIDGDFASVLKHLTDGRRECAVKYHGKIKNHDDVIKVLKVLDAGDRIGFAELKHTLITSGNQFAMVVECLPEDDQLKFAVRHRNKLTSKKQFSHFFAKFNKTDFLDKFSYYIIDKIPQLFEVVDLIANIKPCLRMEMVTKLQHLISGPSELCRISGALTDTNMTAEQCWEFAMNNQQHLTDIYTLRTVMSLMTNEMREKFVLMHEKLIESFGHRGRSMMQGVSMFSQPPGGTDHHEKHSVRSLGLGYP